jgi:bifunctional DNase/RNase
MGDDEEPPGAESAPISVVTADRAASELAEAEADAATEPVEEPTLFSSAGEAARDEQEPDPGEGTTRPDEPGDEVAAFEVPEHDGDEPGELGTFEDAILADSDDDPLVTPPEMSQMLFVDVVLLLPATHPVVVLQEADSPYRELRIPVGGAEGIAIGYAARGLETPRPLTHELFANVLEEFGMTVEVVRITEVRGTAFTSEMVISGPSGARVIDCRPSDAIALALRQRLPVPIMAAPNVLTRAGTDPAGVN